MDDESELTVDENMKELSSFDRAKKAPALARTAGTKTGRRKPKTKVKDVQAQLVESRKELEILKEYTRKVANIERRKVRSKCFHGSIIDVAFPTSEP
ncbi:unnamed protein product [Sympodiomycopsis kandeliae]